MNVNEKLCTHRGIGYCICGYIIIIIIIIKRDWQCKAGRERSTPYQYEDPNPTTPTLERKKRKGKQ